MPNYFGTPPQLLCKYLPPEGIRVLQNQRIRFTPMLGTNDPFEIRQTFEVALGPKADEHLASALARADVGNIAQTVAAQIGGDASSIDTEQVRQLAIRLAREKIIPAFNSPQNVDALLKNVGGRSCALSLTNDPHSPPMWAHYASGWKGFVLYLNTASQFFRRDERGRVIKLERVEYRDEPDAELIANIRAPLLTKLLRWSYEQEWRLIIDADNFPPSDDPDEQEAADLQLRKVPPSAFAKILLGANASDDLVAQCVALRATSLPHLKLFRARPVPFAGEVVEEPVAL